MDGWKYWLEKKVFIILKNKRQYSGRVLEIDDKSPPLIWLILLDKFGNRVQFLVDEIETIEEEE